METRTGQIQLFIYPWKLSNNVSKLCLSIDHLLRLVYSPSLVSLIFLLFILDALYYWLQIWLKYKRNVFLLECYIIFSFLILMQPCAWDIGGGKNIYCFGVLQRRWSFYVHSTTPRENSRRNCKTFYAATWFVWTFYFFGATSLFHV